MIDCGPQGSVADWLGINSENTFFDLLMDRVRLRDCVYQAREKLNIIPSDKRLALAEVRLAKDKDMEKAFQKKLASLKDYDFIFLDCPLSLTKFGNIYIILERFSGIGSTLQKG